MAPPPPGTEYAKTLLTLALLRPDPQPCPKDATDTIVAMLQAVVNQCDARNVQECKYWAISNLVFASNRRVEPFCNYLIALSNSFQDEDADNKTTGSKPAGETRVPSASRRRLHILYLLSDIMYHAKVRLRNDAFITNIQPKLPALFKSAASFKERPKQVAKLQALISLWSEWGYLTEAVIQALRTAVEEGKTGGAQGTETQDPVASAPAPKPVPFVLPKTHGDPSTPWYDLPAANWMPWIDGRYPMDPHKIKPIEFKPGPPRQEVIDAVTKTLEDVKRIYAKGPVLEPGDAKLDISELGERLERGANGEITGGDTYYGWSREFCEERKREERERAARKRASTRSPSRTPSPARKRHRRQRSLSADSYYSEPDNDRSRSASIGSSRHSGQSNRDNNNNRYQQSGPPRQTRSRSAGSDHRGAHGGRQPPNFNSGGFQAPHQLPGANMYHAQQPYSYPLDAQFGMPPYPQGPQLPQSFQAGPPYTMENAPPMPQHMNMNAQWQTNQQPWHQQPYHQQGWARGGYQGHGNGNGYGWNGNGRGRGYYQGGGGKRY